VLLVQKKLQQWQFIRNWACAATSVISIFHVNLLSRVIKTACNKSVYYEHKNCFQKQEVAEVFWKKKFGHRGKELKSPLTV